MAQHPQNMAQQASSKPSTPVHLRADGWVSTRARRRRRRSRAALLADPVLPSDRDAEEHREDEEGQKEYEPDDPPTEPENDARLFRLQDVLANTWVAEDGADLGF